MGPGRSVYGLSVYVCANKQIDSRLKNVEFEKVKKLYSTSSISDPVSNSDPGSLLEDLQYYIIIY